MSTSVYDVIVLGLGGMGSSAAYHLATRNKRVLGLERYGSPHDRGSSHGHSRVIRQSYFEHPAYVPLLLRAYELWEKLERETDRDLMTLCGGLMIGDEKSAVVAGSLASARQHDLPHEILNASEIRQRYPLLSPQDNEIAFYEKRAGWVHPEETVRAHLGRAAAMGAELHFHEPVTKWQAKPGGDGVVVTTAQGKYEASRLVIAPGAWAPETLAALGVPLEVERQILFWFEPTQDLAAFDSAHFPVYIWECEDGVQFYGFPTQAGVPGVKVAFFRMAQVGLGQTGSPETIDRIVHPHEIDAMRSYLAPRIPVLSGKFLDARTCLYTTTPDEHFVIAQHPEHRQVAIACGFSGHGYKFASVVGEILADLSCDGATSHSINLFAPQRFPGHM